MAVLTTKRWLTFRSGLSLRPGRHVVPDVEVERAMRDPETARWFELGLVEVEAAPQAVQEPPRSAEGVGGESLPPPPEDPLLAAPAALQEDTEPEPEPTPAPKRRRRKP